MRRTLHLHRDESKVQNGTYNGPDPSLARAGVGPRDAPIAEDLPSQLIHISEPTVQEYRVLSDPITISVLLFMFVSVLVVLAAIFIHQQRSDRRQREQAARHESKITALAVRQDQVAETIQPLVATQAPLVTPINRLSFEESLRGDLFAETSLAIANEQITEALAARAGDGVTLTANAVTLTPTGVELTVGLSVEGEKALREGTAIISRHSASGRLLPELKDARTGKFMEKMKEIPVKNAVSKLGKASAAIVGAAHMIAGADISKRLRIIDRKIDLLIAYRQFDQFARLERIYASAAEIGSGPIGRYEIEQLWRLRGELQELRYTWRRELHHRLSTINDPNSMPWFKRWFTRKKTRDKRIHKEITDSELQISLIEYSMRLDHVLALGGDQIDKYELTLERELTDLEGVAKMLKDKSRYITGKYPETSVKPTVKAINTIVREYRTLLPASEPMGDAWANQDLLPD